MKRKFFSYLHVSDHPLPRVVTAALVAAHVSVGAGTVVAAPPGLQAGVGAVLARVLLTCSHTLHPLWPLSGLSLLTVLVPQQGEHTDVVPGAAEPEGGPGEVHGVFVVAAERPVIPAGVLTLPPQPVVLAVPRGVQGAPQPGPVSPGAAPVCLALRRHVSCVLYCTVLYFNVLYCTVLHCTVLGIFYVYASPCR